MPDRHSTYGHSCGTGQLSIEEDRTDAPAEKRRPRYGHVCGSGQLSIEEDQSERQGFVGIDPLVQERQAPDC